MRHKLFVLASSSPRRKLLLKRIIKHFKVIPSTIDESIIKAKTPASFAVKAALAKALDVAKQFRDGIVIGADTIVVLGKKILGKPRNGKEARKILRLLSGKTHKVITGIAVVDVESGRIYADFEVTKVAMKSLSGKQIHDYVASGSPMDKAGAYGIQEIEKAFVKKIVGDYDNVVGLPVKKLKTLLKQIRHSE
jgi:septum formation protein